MKKKILFCILCISLVFLFSNTNLKGDTGYNDPAKPHYSWGRVTWTTKDKKASHYPTWETVGFTLRPNKCLPSPYNGNPLWDKNTTKNYAFLMLKDDWKVNDPISDVVTETTFTIPKDDVAKAVDKAGVTPETLDENNYYIYLNGIFHVNYSSKSHSSKIYTLDEIKYPKGVNWYNKDDFKDRFDVPVPYEPLPQPVSIRYMQTDNNYKKTVKVIDNSDILWGEKYESNPQYTYQDGCGLGFSTYKYPTKNKMSISDHSIPMKKSKIVNGVTDEYYLYRVYWTKIKDKIKDTSTGKLRKARGSMTVQANPYDNLAQYKTELDVIRNRVFTVEDGGIEIVAVYKKFKVPELPEDESNSTSISKDFAEPTVSGSIDADEYGNTMFSAQDGIPTTETVYTTVKTSAQTLIKYKFMKYYGTKNYKQKKLDVEASKAAKKDIYTFEYVERDYTYYTVKGLDIYTLDKSIVNNYCLPGESVTIKAQGNVTITSFEYKQYGGESNHLEEPQEDVQDVGQIKVRNDRLIINGMNVLDDNWVEKKSTAPKVSVFTSLTKSSDYGPGGCFFKSGLLIDAIKENSENDSDGTLYYKNDAHIGSASDKTLEYEIEDINSVVIHTPTVCDVKISNDKANNQMITPDQSRASLVLDRNFSLNFPGYGSHLDIKGYGTRDYTKYIATKQVSFPFDVYLNGKYFSANTWITIDHEITSFYLPTWVDEGSYTINCRSISINAMANDGLDLTESKANLDIENYVATDEIDIEVSGRIYGLNLYDISDYPAWENVFRYPNSLKLTGFKYTVGTRNQNGNSNNQIARYTLTPVNGSHPIYENLGAIKLGYATRFSLQTVGNMFGANDYIRITPKFYYVDYSGKNKKEVDVYYSETFQNKKQNLVKVGSDKDKLNKKAYYLGDKYLTVPESEIENTAKIMNTDINQLKSIKKNIWTFDNIMIPDSLRTFFGDKFNGSLGVSDGVNTDTITKSVQNWYCEYYLPSETYVVEKGFDLQNYIKNNRGIDYKESFWLHNGYIIINFEIETIQNGERHLSYLNETNESNGYCNMWKREGYTYQKTDFLGNRFDFSNGDYVMYYTDKSAAKDYHSSGTH